MLPIDNDEFRRNSEEWRRQHGIKSAQERADEIGLNSSKS